MCVSFWPVHFSKTITGTWEVLVDGRINHVLWYQNNVGEGTTRQASTLADDICFQIILHEALAGENWREKYSDSMRDHNIEYFTVEEEIAHRQAGGRERGLSQILSSYTIPDLREGEGNSLIIPLLGSWSSIRLLNTMDVPNILEDISYSLAEPTPIALSFGTGASDGGGDGGIVFVQLGIYDIVIAKDASSLPSALAQIHPLKRPTVNTSVFETLEQWYRCPVAVCCFNNAESGKAKPLAFAFEPLYPDKLVVYTLDAHDGKPPDPTASVVLDHTVFVGSYLTPPSIGAAVKYGDEIPEHMQPYVLQNVMGTRIDEKLENGDIIFSTSDVRAGKFDGLRVLPPFVPHSVPRLGHRITRSVGYI